MECFSWGWYVQDELYCHNKDSHFKKPVKRWYSVKKINNNFVKKKILMLFWFCVLNQNDERMPSRWLFVSCKYLSTEITNIISDRFHSWLSFCGNQVTLKLPVKSRTILCNDLYYFVALKNVVLVYLLSYFIHTIRQDPGLSKLDSP